HPCENKQPTNDLSHIPSLIVVPVKFRQTPCRPVQYSTAAPQKKVTQTGNRFAALPSLTSRAQAAMMIVGILYPCCENIGNARGAFLSEGKGPENRKAEIARTGGAAA